MCRGRRTLFTRCPVSTQKQHLRCSRPRARGDLPSVQQGFKVFMKIEIVLIETRWPEKPQAPTLAFVLFSSFFVCGKFQVKFIFQVKFTSSLCKKGEGRKGEGRACLLLRRRLGTPCARHLCAQPTQTRPPREFNSTQRERKPPNKNKTTNAHALYGLPRLFHSRQLLEEY